tara:strand:- start:422 stop:592 length:171 start_codon:yes stop_codon:yes gene_type:complete
MRPIPGSKLKGSGQWLDGMTSAISAWPLTFDAECPARALLLRHGISERRVMMLNRG